MNDALNLLTASDSLAGGQHKIEDSFGQAAEPQSPSTGILTWNRSISRWLNRH